MKGPTLADLKAATTASAAIDAALDFERSRGSTRPEWIFPVRVKTISEANRRRFTSRGGMIAAFARAKKQKEVARVSTLAALRAGPAWPADLLAIGIRLMRHAPSDGLDDDNLRSALKAVRDGVALALGVDDGDRRLVWHYAEKRAPRGVYFVTVALFPTRGGK